MKKLLILILFLLVATPVSAAYYVNDPTNCLSSDPATYPGQDCTPDNICGVVSGIVQCYDNSTIAPPSSAVTSNTLYSGSFGGGYIMDCYRATTCNAGYCNRDATCYSTKYRDTSCTADAWETATCGSCRSGYLDCTGDDVCEIAVGSTAWSTPNTTYLTCSTGQCVSGYQACEGDTATDDGCNYQTGVTSCDAGGGEPGVIGAGCSCTALPQENFVTNTLASAWGNFLLWGEQLNPTGWLMNLFNSNTGASFRVDQDGNASTTASMTATSFCIADDCVTEWSTSAFATTTADYWYSTKWVWATSSEQYFWNNTTTWAYYDTNWARNYNATTTLNGFTPSDYLATSDFGTYFATSYNATTTLNGFTPADFLAISDFSTYFNTNYNATTTLNGFTPSDYLATADFGTYFETSYNATTTLNGFTDNSTNWDTAYGWGDWSTQGFLTGNLFNQWLDTTSTPTFAGVNATTTNTDYLQVYNDVQIDGNATTTGSVHLGSNTAGINIKEYDSGAGFIGSIISGDLSIPETLDFPGGGIFMDNRLAILHNPDDVFGTLTNGFSPEILMISSSSDAWSIGVTDDDDSILTLKPKFDNASVYISGNSGEGTTGGNLGIYGDLEVGRNATTTGGHYIGNNIYMPTNKGLYTGSQLLAFGDTSDHSYFFGGAGNLTSTGDYNTGLGEDALASIQNGTHNTALGTFALTNGTSALSNIAIGNYALGSLINGVNNVAVGDSALYSSEEENYNVGIGYGSLAFNITGTENVAVGAISGYYGSGSYNTFLGYKAGEGTSEADNNNNTAIGYLTGRDLTTGSNNVFLGSDTGKLISSGSDNILIGYDVHATASSTSNYINIGNLFTGDTSIFVATITGDLEATGYVTGRPSRKSPISMSTEFMNNQGNTFDEWLGGTYGSGTLGSGGEDDHPGTITLSDSTTLGGGYYIETSSVGIDLSGNESTEFVFQINKTAEVKCRFGFQDTFFGATSTDALYFSMVSSNKLKAFACNNSTCTEADTDYTFTTNTWYAGLIETNSDATEATFTLYNEDGTSLWTETITTNVPTGATRKVGHGVGCFEYTTGAGSAMMTLDYMNLYFNRNFTR